MKRRWSRTPETNTTPELSVRLRFSHRWFLRGHLRVAPPGRPAQPFACLLVREDCGNRASLERRLPSASFFRPYREGVRLDVDRDHRPVGNVRVRPKLNVATRKDHGDGTLALVVVHVSRADVGHVVRSNAATGSPVTGSTGPPLSASGPISRHLPQRAKRSPRASATIRGSASPGGRDRVADTMSPEMIAAAARAVVRTNLRRLSLSPSALI